MAGQLNAGLKLNASFRDGITHAWNGHAEELKRAFGIITKDQLSGKLQTLIDDPKVRRGILRYKDPDTGVLKNQYWFFNEQTNVYAVFDKAGDLVDTYPVQRGFDYVMTGQNFRWQLEIK